MDRPKIIRWIHKLELLAGHPSTPPMEAAAAKDKAAAMKLEWQVTREEVTQSIPFEAEAAGEDETFIVRKAARTRSTMRVDWERFERYVTMRLSPDFSCLVHSDGRFCFLAHMIDRHLNDAIDIVYAWQAWLMTRLGPALEAPKYIVRDTEENLVKVMEDWQAGHPLMLPETSAITTFTPTTELVWAGGDNEEKGHAARLDLVALAQAAAMKVQALAHEKKRRTTVRKPRLEADMAVDTEGESQEIPAPLVTTMKALENGGK